LDGNKIPHFSVSVREGMLAFNKKEDMQNYVSSIDILKSRWDYKNTVKPHLEETANAKNNNTPETIEGYFETLEYVGDDVKNSVDLAMNFSSLRKQYINWEWANLIGDSIMVIINFK
jgi:aspartokinase